MTRHRARHEDRALRIGCTPTDILTIFHSVTIVSGKGGPKSKNELLVGLCWQAGCCCVCQWAMRLANQFDSCINAQSPSIIISCTDKCVSVATESNRIRAVAGGYRRCPNDGRGMVLSHDLPIQSSIKA